MDDITPVELDSQPGMKIDFSRYLPILDDDDISDEDKRALLEALWSITLSFVRLGWGKNAAQQALASRQMREIVCGQAPLSSRDGGDESAIMIKCEDQDLVEEFTIAVAGPSQEESDS